MIRVSRINNIATEIIIMTSLFLAKNDYVSVFLSPVPVLSFGGTGGEGLGTGFIGGTTGLTGEGGISGVGSGSGVGFGSGGLGFDGSG